MKVSKPNEFEVKTPSNSVKNLIKNIESILKKEKKKIVDKSFDIFINEEYDATTIESVINIYIENGWRRVEGDVIGTDDMKITCFKFYL